jgi:hypothetical protein
MGLSALALGACLLLGLPALANELDLESFPAGTIVFAIPSGGGYIQVLGYNPALGDVNAAVIFDSANPTGGDVDLGTPNEAFGGPGIGAGGTVSNDTALGNLLIIDESLTDTDSDGLVDDPDDTDEHGVLFEFDFKPLTHNNKGEVTINSVTVVDIEREQGEDGAFIELSGKDIPTALIGIPPTGNNGVHTIDGIALEGVQMMRITLNGSGAIESIVFDDEQPGTCWITTGGFHNSGIQSGSKDYTFGGNVGPPPSGSWEVVDHNTGDNFHSNDVQITECVVIPGTGPQQPGGKKGFEINQAFFEGTGRLNGVHGYPFTGYVIDGGEPANKKGNDPDYFQIVVYDPDTWAVVFEASGELDGGNVQIHPPNGSMQ